MDTALRCGASRGPVIGACGVRSAPGQLCCPSPRSIASGAGDARSPKGR